MMKRAVSALLVLVLSLSGALPMMAETYTETQSAPPVAEAAPSPKPNPVDMEALMAQYPGLVKLEISEDGSLSPDRPEEWIDAGDTWRNTGTLAQTEISKTFETGEALVTLRMDEVSVSLTPLMIEEATTQPMTEVADGQQIGERQTASNVLRIGAATRRRPDRIPGQLRGRGQRRMRKAAEIETISATPAVYEALFDAQTDVELIALSGGVKENVVIGAYTGNHVYAYRMELNGLTPQQDGQRILLHDAAGAQRAEIPAPFMNDAKGVYSEAIAVSLESLGGGAWQLTYEPEDAWLAAPERAYPVVLDPEVKHTVLSDGVIWDAEVFSNWKDENFGGEDSLRSGTSSGETYRSFIHPVFPDAMRDKFLLIQKATFGIHADGEYEGDFDLWMVTDAWGEGTITYRNQPGTSWDGATLSAYGPGWHEADITNIASRWFDVFDQQENHGIRLSGNTFPGTFKRFQSRESGESPYFDFYYWKELPDLNVKATGYAASRNATTGWVELTWDKIPGIDNYYVGIYSGRRDAKDNALYDYIFVEGKNSYTTKGKGLWPTPAEIAAGKSAVHLDGKGAELAADAFPVYKNAKDTQRATDPNYYFRVVPSNSAGQLPSDAGVESIPVILPVDRPPTKPTAVTAVPASWTNADEVTIAWNGTVYYDYDQLKFTPNLGDGGYMEYSINPDPYGAAQPVWQPTGKVLGTDSFVLPTRLAQADEPEPDPAETPDSPPETDPDTPAPPTYTHWPDGEYLVAVRGVGDNGKAGESRPATVRIDKTGPTAATQFDALPNAWSNAATASFTWSGITDLTNLKRVEWRAWDETWHDTGSTGKFDTGIVQDTAYLPDGQHTVFLRGVDVVGNLGEAAQADIFVDRDGPAVDAAGFLPGEYSNQDSLTFYWQGLRDEHSGLFSAGYAWGGDELTDIDIALVDGEAAFDVSEWADGPYNLTFERVDNIGNSATDVLPFYRDTVGPTIDLIGLADGDYIGGITELWTQVEDDTLAGWTLTVIQTDDTRAVVAEGTEPVLSELTALLNTLQFGDGETITIELHAVDKAGNESRQTVSVEVARMVPLPVGVGIIAPTKGQIITVPSYTGSYKPTYSGSERSATAYLDSVMTELNTDRRTFRIPAVTYPEGSSHTAVIISEDTNGILHYSAGLGARLIISDVLGEDGSSIAASQGLTITDGGAVLGEGGFLESVEETAQRPMLGLRLAAHEELADGNGLAYSYSTDGGTNWLPVTPGRDVRFAGPQTRLKVRAERTGSGEDPVLQDWTIESIVEFNPIRYSVRLAREAQRFRLDDGTLREALTALGDSVPDKVADAALYADGEAHESELVFDTLSTTEGKSHLVAGVARSTNGEAYGSGQAQSLLLWRENPEAEGTWLSKPITASRDIYALRVLALVDGGAARFSYTDDAGASWHRLAQDEYVYLGYAARSLQFKAQMDAGAKLRGWHVEGVAADTVRVKVQLIQNPQHVVATDYSEYYQNPKLQMHQLSWADPTPADKTHPNSTAYLVERDGKQLAEVDTVGYMDEEMVAGARYRVRAVRTYDKLNNDHNPHYLVRESAWVAAESVQLKPVERVYGVTPDLGEMNQAEYVDWLYGGGYTLSSEPHPPTGGREFDEKLLGSQKFCAIGFEPINFNTGNFYLMAQDVHVPDAGGTALSVVRTYNTQSEEQNGPFGARWNTDYAEHLVLYGDGSLGFRRGDGRLNIFTRQPDGSYVGNDEDGLMLRIDEAQNEYQLLEKDGTIHAFTGAGLLKRLEQANGQAIVIDRDEDGLITGITAPSGAKLAVEMDAAGHITSLTTPGGASTTYAYEGNHLTQVTGPDGASTCYRYDGQGRMTEWYDASGARQVYNKYDEQNRVVYQEDALGGQYALAYFDDRTETTDAEGNRSTVYFDEQKRSIREVDALGNETRSTYDANGFLASETDARGRTLIYTNDARGNRLTLTTPDGATTRYEYDADNNLIRQTDALGNATVYEYDDQHHLLRRVNADGGVITYAYDDLGNLVSQTDALGAVTAYAYDARGFMTAQTDALGNATAYAYDADGRLLTSTDALGGVTAYAYDAKGNLAALTFADGTRATYAYDTMGRQTSMTDPLGNVTQYQYDALGNLLATTLPDGTTEKATYTPNYQLASITDALGAKTSYEYDATGNLIAETDALGAVTAYTYDEAGWKTATVQPTGARETYTYNPDNGLLAESTDASGLVNRLAYDLAGNLLTRTLPGGAQLHNEYDAMGRLVKQTSPLGGVTEIAYDLNGNITGLTDPLGAETRFTYDAAGRLLTTTDALGATTTTAYDALGRIASMTDALGSVTTYAYDATGNLASVTDALGNVSAYAYDANGAMTAVTDALGNAVQLAYDNRGQATYLTQKNGGQVATTYDKAGRVIAEVDALGRKTRYKYDALGRVTQVTDPLEQKAQFAYDALGNLTRITAPGGGQVLYAYDDAGRLASQTDEAGLVTKYAYDERGQIASVAANGHASTFAYDAAGNVASVTDAEGRTVRFAYDLAGRQTKTIYPDDSFDETVYDALGRVSESRPRGELPMAYEYDAAGRVTRVTQGERSTTYEYDALGRLILTTLPDGATQAYAYDALGNLVGETDALGAQTRYAYDAESWLERITYANGGQQSFARDLVGQVLASTGADGDVTQYAYDKVGRLTAVTDALGNATKYKYNPLDQVAQVTDALGNLTAYTYTLRGELATETDALGNKTQYAYTPEGWLASVTKPNGAVTTYTYDMTGQLLAQDAAGEAITSRAYNEIGLVTTTETPEGTTTYQYNERSQLVSVQHPDGSTLQYAYDAYGRKTGLTYPDGRVVRYEYDAMDRLVKVTGLNGEVTEYAYDAAGRRTETKAANLTTTYAYDPMGNLTQQTTTDSSALNLAYTYSTGGRMLSETRTEGGSTVTSGYVYDALGQLVHYSRSGQTETYAESYRYDAAGNMKQKAILSQGTETPVTMAYNKGNQLTQMSTAAGKIGYQYDKNGNLVSKTLGKQRDTYAYDALDRLTGYTGYDGFAQTYSYDAHSLRSEMQQKGSTERQTLEQMILPSVALPASPNTDSLVSDAKVQGDRKALGASPQGSETPPSTDLVETPKVEGDRKALEAFSSEGPGRPESPGRSPTESETLPFLNDLPTDAQQQKVTSIGTDESQNIEPDVDTWIKTSYIYDITQPYGQLLTETTGSSLTVYTYGLERISAHTQQSKAGSLTTQYIYDGRGSVAQTISVPGASPSVATPNASAPSVSVASFAYTPFGSPLTPAAQTTGFGYNAELYDSVTGMQYLRARVYESNLMRFSQKDILRGGLVKPLSLNRYAYVRNDPINKIDPSGMRPAEEDEAKRYYVEQTVKIKTNAISSAAAAGTVTEAQLDNWAKYCQDNYENLPPDVRDAYDEAKQSGGGSAAARNMAMLHACRSLSDPPPVEPMPAPNKQAEPSAYEIDAISSASGLVQIPIDLITGTRTWYFESNQRGQQDTKFDGASKAMVGQYYKISVINNTRVAQIVGDDKAGIALKTVHDIATASTSAGFAYQGGAGISLKAKASVYSGRSTVKFNILGKEIELGINLDLGSIGGELSIISTPADGFKVQVGASALVGGGFLFRIK